MIDKKKEILKLIRKKAIKRLEVLSKEMVYAKSEEKETILAEIEFHKTTIEHCDLCLE